MSATLPVDPLRLNVTGPAREDISSILRYSISHFGSAAARRYDSLIKQAFRDLLVDPRRVGSKPRPELPPGIRIYHLGSSRERLLGETVKEPRHFLAHRITASTVEILRVLYNTCDLARHLPE